MFAVIRQCRPGARDVDAADFGIGVGLGTGQYRRDSRSDERRGRDGGIVVASRRRRRLGITGKRGIRQGCLVRYGIGHSRVHEGRRGDTGILLPLGLGRGRRCSGKCR